MTPISLDCSQRRELALHAQVIHDVVVEAEPLGIAPLIVGAFARDLHLFYSYGIETLRQTEDLDLAVAVPNWDAFNALQTRLIATARFSVSPAAAHRLRHRNDLPIDLVPFGNVENRERKIAWPPRGEIVMDVFGFQEVAAKAQHVILPDHVRVPVVSLSALALLKIVCWHDRHYVSPGKDAHDLLLIIKNYLQAGNQPRLFEEFVEWTQEEDFDFELAGARMLGYDIRAFLDDTSVPRVAGLFAEQTNAHKPGRLAAEMIPLDQDRARALLDAILHGMMES